MNSSQRKVSLAVLGVLSAFVFIAPSVSTVFAWNYCGITLSPSGQSTTVPAGTTTSLTYLLTYSDTPYPASFTITATSSNGAWTVVSVIPSQVPSSGKSGSISQTITVSVTAPGSPSSTTTLTVKAANNQDGSRDCSARTTLTAGAFPPPPNGVPQFPFGIALLMALAIPALLVAKSKYSVSVKQ